jgi:hypothetical protein
MDDLSHPHEQYEDAVAEAAFGIINKSLHQYFQNNKQKRISEYIVDNAKGLAVMRNFGSEAVPERGVEIRVPATVKGHQSPIGDQLVIRIKPTQKDTGADFGTSILNIYLNVNTIAQAKEYNDLPLQAMISRLYFQLHHEMTHLSSGKVSPGNQQHANPYLSGSHPRGSPEYDKGKIDYFTDPGELRAHAKQYAALYARYYPGQPYDVNKMMALAPLSDKIERYFKGFEEQGQSKVWGMDVSPYQGQLQAAGQRFNALMEYFLKMINQRQQQPKKFGEWMEYKLDSPRPQAHPAFVDFVEAYGKGNWKEVARVAGWPEGAEVHEFVRLIKERIKKHGHLPQREWHMKKLSAKVRSVLPEHTRLGRVGDPAF